jgi:hypothetical protein
MMVLITVTSGNYLKDFKIHLRSLLSDNSETKVHLSGLQIQDNYQFIHSSHPPWLIHVDK